MRRSRSPARHRADPRGRTKGRSRSRSTSPPTRDIQRNRDPKHGEGRSRSRSRSPRRGHWRTDPRPRETQKARWERADDEHQDRETGRPDRTTPDGRRWEDERDRGRFEDRTNAREGLSGPSHPQETAGGNAADDTTEDEEAKMMAMMGMPVGFGSTKGQQVDDPKANVGDAMVKTKRQARQYMNRRGGFNRPLPAEKTGQRHLYGQ
eukprot:scaffold1681_cov332-Pavlova_lutheri.AAC.18